jgi:preprotein translocase subunit SecG
MVVLITIVHVLVSFFLVVVVLLQSGKAADLAGAFGGLGSQTVFGPRGSATVLTRATTISAILFMVTSLTLSVLSSGTAAGPAGGGGDILDPVSAPAGQAAPAAPAPPGGSPGSISVEVNGKTQTLPIPGQTPAPEAPKK